MSLTLCYPRNSFSDIMAVAMHCAVCNVPGLVFPCARCRGLFCGCCVWQHGGPANDYTAVEEGNGYIDDVAQGMHQLFVVIAQRKASDAAADPAMAAVRNELARYSR